MWIVGGIFILILKKYSWWNPRVKARQRGIGWRIDYMLVREKDMEKVSHTDILNDIMGSDRVGIINIGYKYFNYILFKYLY